MQSMQTSLHSHFRPTLTTFHSTMKGGLKLAGFVPWVSRINPTVALSAAAAGRHARKNNSKNTPKHEEDEPLESEWLSDEDEEDGDFEYDEEAAGILMGNFDDPEKVRKKVEDRLKRKQKKIFQPKTGSAEAMNVTFNNFDFSDSYIWIEFERSPSDKDLALISGAMRSWYMLGHLGGYNSMNLQLTELPIDKQPTYDSARATKVEFDGVAFENIGDIEIQDNLARIWVDIANSDPLVLDVLINSLKSLSSDFIGIKQLVFGGKHWGNWEEEKTSSQDGYRIWTI